MHVSLISSVLNNRFYCTHAGTNIITDHKFLHWYALGMIIDQSVHLTGITDEGIIIVKVIHIDMPQ